MELSKLMVSIVINSISFVLVVLGLRLARLSRMASEVLFEAVEEGLNRAKGGDVKGAFAALAWAENHAEHSLNAIESLKLWKWRRSAFVKGSAKEAALMSKKPHMKIRITSTGVSDAS